MQLEVEIDFMLVVFLISHHPAENCNMPNMLFSK